MKERYGLAQTSELVRFQITMIVTAVEKEGHIPFAPSMNDLIVESINPLKLILP